MAVPQINTYHCICTSLLLATTHTLSTLPHRASPSLDSAIIVPLPSAPPQPPSRASSSPSSHSEGEDEDEEDAAAQPKEPENALGVLGYTVLLSTTLDRRPTLIRRSDGFERRFLLRCGRCRLVVGYELDAEHYAASLGAVGAGSAKTASDMDVDGDLKGKERMKIVYLLPGGIMSTEIMASGKKVGEKEVVLGEGERTTVVAAWE